MALKALATALPSRPDPPISPAFREREPEPEPDDAYARLSYQEQARLRCDRFSHAASHNFWDEWRRAWDERGELVEL